MTIRKIEVERLDLTSSKSFEAVVADVEEAISQPDMKEFTKVVRAATKYAELERLVRWSVSDIGLMLFMKLDAGAILRKESGRAWPKVERFLIGNPLIMKEMAKHVPDAGSYAPVTILVDERSDGVHLTYDRMASILAPYGNPDALRVAQDLDVRVEKLLNEAAA
jgi:uncharacterized protein (DUF302 family)